MTKFAESVHAAMRIRRHNVPKLDEYLDLAMPPLTGLSLRIEDSQVELGRHVAERHIASMQHAGGFVNMVQVIERQDVPRYTLL